MKNDMIYRALEYVDETYLEAAADAIQSRTKPRLIRRWALTAACFLLIVTVGLLPLIPRLAEEPPIPDEGMVISATDIAAIFNVQYDSVATTSYQKVYAPDISVLSLSPLPDTEYVSLYEYIDVKVPLDLESYTEHTGIMMEKISKSLNISVPNYEIKYGNYSSGSRYSTIIIEPSDYNISTFQLPAYDAVHIYHDSNNPKPVTLDGETVSVRQTQSDEEIIESLSGIRDKLFTLFDVSFTDVRVVRRYNSYSSHGVAHLYVYFYNASDHPLNDISPKTPYSDYLFLDFDNFVNYSGDMVSDDILYDVWISYYKYRTTPESRYRELGQKRLLPLKEAEALLEKGYTFGGHTCPLCMAAQTPIDFSDYDYVSLEYVKNTTYSSQTNLWLPFYTFYKDIGESENGNRIYAKTYVPAVKVQGLDEYFKAQESNHPKTSDVR